MMRKVFQTKFGKEGNCTQACICSILELPIEDAPEVTDERCWLNVINDWLHPKGFVLVVVAVNGKPRVYPQECFYVVGGKSPRDIGHSVVYQGEIMVHDPHPEGGGLVGEANYLYFLCPKTICGE